MRTHDDDIYRDFPWIIANAEPGCRWLPLRMALEEFDAMNADTLFMDQSGLIARIKRSYVWYGWRAETLIERRNNGLYGVRLLHSMRLDILDGSAIYRDRPWR